MNIFDAHVSGSLSVSGSAEVSGDLTVLGMINASISGVSTNALTASYAPEYTLTSSFNNFTSSYTSGSFTGSFKGSYVGDGTGLYNIPASGVTGLNLTKIISGSISASLDTNGFGINTNTSILGTLNVQNGITGSADFNSLVNKPTLVSGSSQIVISDTIGYGTFSSSLSSSLGVLSSSISLTDSEQTSRIGNLEISTGSLNSFTSSINTTIKNKLNSDNVVSGSIQVSITGTTGYDTFSSSISTNTSTLSSSIATTDLNQNNRLDSLEGDVNSIETTTSSLNSFTSSINTTIKSKMDVDGVISGSSQVVLSGTTGFSTVSASLSSLSSSISITNFNQDDRLTSIENKTGSFATTGSNNFIGNQVITGSVTITQNLNVLGSSSFLIVTSSQLALSSSYISVNVFEPAERFGGLKVYDSGSSFATASLLWDSLNNKWVYQNVSGSGYSGGMLMMGPRNTTMLGDEVGTIANVIMKGMGGDHISGSNIIDDGTSVRINSDTIVTGSLIVTSTISGSNITLIETAVGSLNSFTSSINTTIKNKMNSEGVISGSSQVLSGTGIWSGSAQLPAGVVSGSSQITYSNLTGIPSGIVSGSSQITYGSISGIPSGIVSSSAQVVFGSISGIPSGLVSGSSQVLLSSGIWSGSAQLPAGVVSGSSQISYSSISGIPSNIVSSSAQILYSGISGIPSGIISGSGQVSLSSTSGFSSYLNQAVLTTSTPTFSTVSATTFTGALSGNATTATSVSATFTGTNEGNLVYAAIADNDFFRIRVGGTATNAGWAEIATADDGTEPIYVRQYTGTFTSVTRTATLLDGSGNTSFPGSVTASSFSGTVAGSNVSGNISGNAANITAYTINQSVGTGNSPTFAGLTSNNNATLYRDVYINGGTGGNYGNRLIVGGTTTDYTLQDTNVRPTIYMTGAYPVLTLNHTQTSNGSHGPTIQFTHYTADKQWVIGTNGTGTQMDFGYSTNTNRNPHNGIDNYQGNTYLRISNDGYTRTWNHIIPTTSAALDLGTSSYRWRTIYTSDLSLSNGIGDYTIVEGENDLFLYNNKQNKVYKFMLQEVNAEDATPKLPQ